MSQPASLKQNRSLPLVGSALSPTCAPPSASCRDPAGSQAGGPAPQTPRVLAASTAAAALYLAQETQAPLFHLDGASRRFAMETEALSLGTWGPLQGLVVWGCSRGIASQLLAGLCSAAASSQRAAPPGSPKPAPPRATVRRLGAQARCKEGVEAAGCAGSHPGCRLSIVGVGEGGRAPPSPLPPLCSQALQLLQLPAAKSVGLCVTP